MNSRQEDEKTNPVPFWNEFGKSFKIVLAIRLIDLVKDFCTIFPISYYGRMRGRSEGGLS